MAEDGQSRADAGALGAGYERLHSAVLSGGAGGWRLGHGVLATRGTVAWTAALGDFVRARSQRLERRRPSLQPRLGPRCRALARSSPCSPR